MEAAQMTTNYKDLDEFKVDIDELVNLTAALESSKESLNERAKELVEKWEEHHTFNLKAPQFKKVASMIFKDNLQEEQDKANEIFEITEHVSKDS